jgi:hypothetical protein
MSDPIFNDFLMKKLLLVFFLLPLFLDSYAQSKITEQREMLWLGYFNQTRFTNKSGVWVDAHLRYNENFVDELHAILARVGYIYYITDRTRLSAGYAFQKNPGHEGADNILENRPWQQIQWFEKKRGFNMMQYVRLEQRYRKTGDSEYDFLSHRIRYTMAFTIPLTRKEVAPKTPFLFTNNEVFINFGKNIINNYFDQNRFFVGLGYQFTEHLNAQVGYLNVFQQLPAGNRYVHTDAVRLFVFHNLDFRAKD